MTLPFNRFDGGTALDIASTVFSVHGRTLSLVEEVLHVPAHWLAGIVGAENPACDPELVRPDPVASDALLEVARGAGAVPPYRGVAHKTLTGVDWSDNNNHMLTLSSRYGLTQIPGFRLLIPPLAGVAGFPLPLRQATLGHLLSGVMRETANVGRKDLSLPPTVEHSCDPHLNLFIAAHILAHDPALAKWVAAGNAVLDADNIQESPGLNSNAEHASLKQVAHLWNTGETWNGRVEEANTHDPHFLENVTLVASLYYGLARAHAKAMGRIVSESEREEWNKLLRESSTAKREPGRFQEITNPLVSRTFDWPTNPDDPRVFTPDKPHGRHEGHITGEDSTDDRPSWLKRKGKGRFDISPEAFAAEYQQSPDPDEDCPGRETFGPCEEHPEKGDEPHKSVYTYQYPTAARLRELLTSDPRAPHDPPPLFDPDPQPHPAQTAFYETALADSAKLPDLEIVTNIPNPLVYYRGDNNKTLFVIDPKLPLPEDADSADPLTSPTPVTDYYRANTSYVNNQIKLGFLDPEYLTREMARERGIEYPMENTPNIPPRPNAGQIPPYDEGNTSDVSLELVKPGYKTSEGQFTLLFVVLAGIMALFGYKTTPDHLQSAFDSAVAIAKTLGPLVAVAPVLFNFITSRGKLKSNAINASAAVGLARNNVSAVGLLGGAFKKPGTYIDLAKVIAGSGVIPGKAGGVIGQVLGGTPANEVTQQRSLTDEQIVAGFESIGERLKSVEALLDTLSKEVSSIGNDIRVEQGFRATNTRRLEALENMLRGTTLEAGATKKE
jgi:hypothetical protein